MIDPNDVFEVIVEFMDEPTPGEVSLLFAPGELWDEEHTDDDTWIVSGGVNVDGLQSVIDLLEGNPKVGETINIINTDTGESYAGWVEISVLYDKLPSGEREQTPSQLEQRQERWRKRSALRKKSEDFPFDKKIDFRDTFLYVEEGEPISFAGGTDEYQIFSNLGEDQWHKYVELMLDNGVIVEYDGPGNQYIVSPVLIGREDEEEEILPPDTQTEERLERWRKRSSIVQTALRKGQMVHLKESKYYNFGRWERPAFVEVGADTSPSFTPILNNRIYFAAGLPGVIRNAINIDTELAMKLGSVDPGIGYIVELSFGGWLIVNEKDIEKGTEDPDQTEQRQERWRKRSALRKKADTEIPPKPIFSSDGQIHAITYTHAADNYFTMTWKDNGVKVQTNVVKNAGRHDQRVLFYGNPQDISEAQEALDTAYDFFVLFIGREKSPSSQLEDHQERWRKRSSLEIQAHYEKLYELHPITFDDAAKAKLKEIAPVKEFIDNNISDEEWGFLKVGFWSHMPWYDETKYAIYYPNEYRDLIMSEGAPVEEPTESEYLEQAEEQFEQFKDYMSDDEAEQYLEYLEQYHPYYAPIPRGLTNHEIRMILHELNHYVDHLTRGTQFVEETTNYFKDPEKKEIDPPLYFQSPAEQKSFTTEMRYMKGKGVSDDEIIQTMMRTYPNSTEAYWKELLDKIDFQRIAEIVESENLFKVGDIVKAIHDIDYFMGQVPEDKINKDEVLTVERIDEDGRLYFKEIPDRYGPWDSSNFEMVQAGTPSSTEQRQERWRKRSSLRKKALWSVWDTQTNQYMATGSNSPTLQEAIEDIFEYIIGAMEFEFEGEEEEMREMNWHDKKEFCESYEFKFVEEGVEDNDDLTDTKLPYEQTQVQQRMERWRKRSAQGKEQLWIDPQGKEYAIQRDRGHYGWILDNREMLLKNYNIDVNKIIEDVGDGKLKYQTGEGLIEFLLSDGWVRMSGKGDFQVWNIKDENTLDIVGNYIDKYPAYDYVIDFMDPNRNHVRFTTKELGAVGLRDIIDVAPHLERSAETKKELKEELEVLEEELHTDVLTGVYNRRWLEENEDEIIGNYDYMILFDIDHFKKINDDYGHQKGDEILQNVAGILQELLVGNPVIRWGGEEFAVFTSDDLEETMENIRSTVEDITKDTEIPVTVSLGGSVVSDDTEKTFAEIDKALYHSKETGRNKWTVYGEELEGSEVKGEGKEIKSEIMADPLHNYAII